MKENEDIKFLGLDLDPELDTSYLNRKYIWSMTLLQEIGINRPQLRRIMHSQNIPAYYLNGFTTRKWYLNRADVPRIVEILNVKRKKQKPPFGTKIIKKDIS